MARSKADEEAERWKARQMAGATSPEGRQALEAWLAASVENSQAFRRLEIALDVADGVSERFLAAQFESELHDAAKARLAARPRIFGIAAALTLMIGAVAAIAVVNWRPTAARVYETAIGERETVTLADGSTIELNTNTHIEVSLSRTGRAARLSSGEAVFNVARDENRPFSVATRQADVVVAGTVFNVSALHDGTAVYVLSGAVDVTPRVAPASTLLAGDSVAIDADGAASPVMRFDPSRVLSWRTGRLRFAQAPLSEVVGELNRYFPMPIELGDEAIGALPVSGEFKIDDQSAAVRALCLVFTLEARSDDRRIVLQRAPS